MKRAFKSDSSQRLYEQGHPFFVKLAEVQAWPRKTVNNKAAHEWLRREQVEAAHGEAIRNYEKLIQHLESVGENVQEYRAELDRMNADRVRGGVERHAITNEKKHLIRDEWEAWQNGSLNHANTNRFGSYVMGKYGFPADASTIRKWHKKWLRERRARKSVPS